MNKTVSVVRIMLTKKVEHLGDIDSKLDEMTDELEDLGYDVSIDEVEDE